jgi:hypothetical protein
MQKRHANRVKTRTGEPTPDRNAALQAVDDAIRDAIREFNQVNPEGFTVMFLNGQEERQAHALLSEHRSGSDLRWLSDPLRQADEALRPDGAIGGEIELCHEDLLTRK